MIIIVIIMIISVSVSYCLPSGGTEEFKLKTASSGWSPLFSIISWSPTSLQTAKLLVRVPNNRLLSPSEHATFSGNSAIWFPAFWDLSYGWSHFCHSKNQIIPQHIMIASNKDCHVREVLSKCLSLLFYVFVDKKQQQQQQQHLYLPCTYIYAYMVREKKNCLYLIKPGAEIILRFSSQFSRF